MVVLGGCTEANGLVVDCNAMVKRGFGVVLRLRGSTVSAVSLNRCEQLLFDYLEKHPEERQYWMHKVRQAADLCADPHAASLRLDTDLWFYFRERAAIVPVLKDFARSQGQERTSMRNLAEYLLRLWAPQKPKRKGPLSDAPPV